MFYCRACLRVYDGFAQCCYEMDHVELVTSDSDNESSQS